MDELLETVRKTWGFSGLRPLQEEAMRASLAGRDALVVLPTGGGKSLCYQAPAILAGGLTVVVSPLISLMKDQVDGLLERGVGAAFLNSSLDAADRGRVKAAVLRGEYRLLFVAPERFAAEGFEALLDRAGVRAVAIDEAHCISHWGHDFRSDYRELGRLKKLFPGVPIHAFTATATPRVRADIVDQLGLREPAVLVGDFFRPNLRFRAVERDDGYEDVLGEIQQHSGGAGIVYCIRRADVDEMSRRLQRAGVRATAYHAGMDDEARTRAQERWIDGAADVVVATVAFGMGIDRADVRFVIHAAMPQSLEHYQQEAGRAGRDGGPASCVLFWKGADFGLWQALIRGQESSDQENKLRLLGEMYRYCTGSRCRHRAILEYFGQPWKGGPCGACDLCTGQAEPVEGSTGLARRILACIARTGQRFGPAYLVDLLTGTATDRVKERGHRGIEEFGAIADRPRGALFDWIRQMEDGGLVRREGEYGVLRITADGARVLRGEAEAGLYGGTRKPAARKKKRARKPEKESAAEVPVPAEENGNRDLFEVLRDWRRGVAEARGVPAFMIFGDATLRALARRRPATPEALLQVKGIGPYKANAYGTVLLKIVRRGDVRS